jgi:hypothetical protein
MSIVQVDHKESIGTRAALWAASGLCGKRIASNLRQRMRTKAERKEAAKQFKETNEHRRRECLPPLKFWEWHWRLCAEILLNKPDREVPQDQKYALAELLNNDELLRIEKALTALQSDLSRRGLWHADQVLKKAR